MGAASIDVRTDSHGVVVAVAGEVDLSARDELIKAMREAIDTSNGHGVTVNLSGTSFLDSGGIGALVEGRNYADETDVAFRVTGATGLVRQVLAITGVLESLEEG